MSTTFGYRELRTTTDAYEEGYKAFLDSQEKDANPYKKGDARYDEWNEGWQEAKKENPE